MLGDISKRFPGSHVVFIDVHAQKASEHPKVPIDAATWEHSIIVGTQDGRCVKSRAGIYSLSERGLLGGMQKEFSQRDLLGDEILIYPPNNNIPGSSHRKVRFNSDSLPSKDHPQYNGGHIVAEYGFNNTRGLDVDAIQMEFGSRIRKESKLREKVAIAIAKAILSSNYVQPQDSI
eukprot:CAMPEP_0184046514 /NCGR_PEP_ID=MMETSP0956-20121227/1610_1 /TAXON_ID=627963 /ORGANISM="Aplanochytrium sp, Strain PBS07" /LENGTH=175 /DNA_ID=CAMNT_0026338129 /DNA_START=581 /DNA_END=1109 /DNA_ORIENTATION=+